MMIRAFFAWLAIIFNAFFTWLGGVLANPNDNQGSTARLCLLILIATIAVCMFGLTIYLGAFPKIDGTLSAFLLTIIGLLIGKTVWDRKTEAGKTE